MSFHLTSPRRKIKPTRDVEGEQADEAQAPKAKEPIGLIYLPMEVLTQVLSAYITTQQVLEQYFPNPYGDRHFGDYEARPEFARSRRRLEIMMTTSVHTLLQPAVQSFLERSEHAVVDVCKVIREAYVLEVKRHFRPVVFLNRGDLTANGLNGIGASIDSHAWSAPSFMLKLHIKQPGASIVALAQNELDALKPFVQRFYKATEAYIDWQEVVDFRGKGRTHVRGPLSTSRFDSLELLKILQSVRSLKMIRFCSAPTFYKLPAGGWTSDANKYNMEIIKDQWNENIRRKALLKQ
ncbi:hypothetical protein FKW77_003850 [Venturia effusa]|uniref:Uncharacterized protein n=1 Tax=Venturia effusa TaxID=50376 RepID=A0A517LR15_9PEZI|nr:hypothetical protein FKW77_003850 [Venturia effusa]